MNGSFLNNNKVQVLASWAAIHDPRLSLSPLSTWLLSCESDSTLIDTWQRLGAYACLRAMGRQKAHPRHLSSVTNPSLVVREQQAVWWGDHHHLGDLEYFYKHIQPQEAQAALSYETLYSRFSVWLERQHQVCCLEDSPLGIIVFVPAGLALPALTDLWRVFVRHVFSGPELQKTFVLLLNSLSLADRGFSVPDLPLVTHAQVDLMFAFFYATLHAIEQRLKRLDHEATATTKETTLKKLNERRLSQHAIYDGALLHFQVVVEQFQHIPDGYQRLEHIRALAQGFAPQATRQLTATGNVIRKAVTYMEWLLNLPEDALLELPPLLSREPIISEARAAGDQITGMCYACGRTIPPTAKKAYQKQSYKANKLILQSPSQALQGRVQESRPEICIVCAALALACPIKLSVNKGIVVSLSDYKAEQRPEQLYEQYLRMLTIGEQNITAGRYLMIPCTEQAPNGDPLMKHLGGKEYALLKVAAIFPADVLARFHIEVFFSMNPLCLKQRHLVFLSSLLKVFGIQPDAFGKKKDQPHYAAVTDAIRYIEQDRIVFALYRLMSAYQQKQSSVRAQRASLEDALYAYKEQLLMDEKQTFGQRIRHILGLTGILYAFVSRARPISSRSTSPIPTGSGSTTAVPATPLADPQREQREMKKLLEEVDHPVHFTYALANTLNYSTALIWRDLRTYCMYDEAKHLLQQVLQTEEEVTARETITDGKKSLLISQQDIYTVYALLCDRYYSTEKDKRDFTYELKLSLYTCFPDLVPGKQNG